MTDPLNLAPDAILAFHRRVLGLFYRADIRRDLLWHDSPDGSRFAANVSDVFAWGCADAEDITPDTVDALEQAHADCRAAGAEEYTVDLYAARRRGMKPQGAAYPEKPEAQALFDACGPERQVGFGNPRNPKRPTTEKED